MLAIRDSHSNKYISKNHEEVILFDNSNDIDTFINGFFAYAMTRAMQEDLSLVFQIHNLQASLIIEELSENTTMKTVLFSDLKKK